MASVTLSITLTENGQLKLQGPVNDIRSCVFLCEAAKNYLFHRLHAGPENESQPTVIAAPADALPPPPRR